MIRRLLCSAAMISAALCHPRGVTAQNTPLSVEATQHINEIVNALRKSWIRRDTMNWESFQDRVLARAAGSQSIADTYDAIRYGLELLGDRHSHYVATDGRRILAPIKAGYECTPVHFGPPDVPPGIGYLRVSITPPTSTDEIQRLMREQVNRGVSGWIVDLRKSGGGNMWPAFAGLGSLLGDGTAGYFVDASGDALAWGYHRGRAWLGKDTLITVADPVTFETVPNIAVLTDAGVSSAGEAIAIAFRSRSNVRSFGTRTCGLSTANRGAKLSNGATLIITGRYMADRSKKVYGGVVEPDESIADPSALISAAVAWLLDRQP